MAAHSKPTIVVGMSGGVDSSVAALLLKREGYDVRGLFMKNWEDDDTEEYCAAAEDLADAEAVCRRLSIPLDRVNFATEYWDRVFEYFLKEYAEGRTPNPDVLCNREIKFKAFLDYALHLGAEYIATGHYARAAQSDGRFQLLAGHDLGKDQSYFLYTLGQRQLRHSLFPLGNMDKPSVRELAAAAGLDNARKKDSTGICFIGERRFRDFLSRYLPARPGPIKTPEGKKLGLHQGLMYYTLGQRQGLGIGGVQHAEGDPWYVVAKDLESNVLTVAQGHDHPLLFHRRLRAGDLSWVAGAPPAPAFDCHARIRYRQPLQRCRVDSAGEATCEVVFAQPQRAATPGQSVVFYDGDVCLGGGVIRSACG